MTVQGGGDTLEESALLLRCYCPGAGVKISIFTFVVLCRYNPSKCALYHKGECAHQKIFEIFEKKLSYVVERTQICFVRGRVVGWWVNSGQRLAAGAGCRC